MRKLLPLVIVLLLAFGLRVWLLADTNINWDEGYSVWISRLALPTLFDTTARDVHPPLYYLLLRAGRWAFGEGEWAWRYGSVLVGVLAVAMTARFGRAVGGPWVGIVAALLVALSRANVHISQLTRMHILAALLCTGAMWAALRVWQRPSNWRAGLAYVLLTAGALYTFYLAVMLPLAVNAAFVLVMVWAWQRHERGFTLRLTGVWAALNLAAAGLFAPWAWYASRRMFGWSSDSFTPPGFFTQFYFSTLTVGRPTFDAGQLPYAAAYLLVMAAGLWALWRVRRGDFPRLALLLAGIFTPAVVVFLLALPFHDLGRPLAARYLIMLSSAFYVLAAWGIVALTQWRRLIGWGALAITVLVAAWGMSNIADGAMRRDDMHSAAALLHDLRGPDDAVLLHNDKTWTTLAALYGDTFDVVRQGESVSAGYADYLLGPIAEDHGRVWLLTTPAARQNDPANIIAGWLEARSAATYNWPFNDHALTVYALDGAPLPRTLPAPPHLSHAAPEVGLAGATRPMRRYPVGDAVHLALYWSHLPAAPAALTLTRPGAEPIAHAVPAVDGEAIPPGEVLRQQVAVPLPPGTTPGRYQMALQVDDVRVGLGAVQVVALSQPEVATEADISQRLDVPFGEAITLVGTGPLPERVRGGQDVTVTLYWRTQTTLTDRYKVSVFLQGEAFNPATNNPLWGQVDTEPRNWSLPTTLWPPDTLLEDPYTFTVAAGIPPGAYTLRVVMYHAVTGERLPTPSGDTADLARVTVR